MEKTPENQNQQAQSRAVAENVAQLKVGSGGTLTFVDNRPEAAAQRRMAEMMRNSPQAKQAAQMQNSPHHAAQNRMADMIRGTVQAVIQRATVNVNLQSGNFSWNGVSNNVPTTETKMDKEFGGNNAKDIFAQHVKKKESWSIYNCSEPHAFSQMVETSVDKEDFVNRIQGARMGQATTNGAPIERCKNCRQWLKGSPASFNNRIKQDIIKDMVKK